MVWSKCTSGGDQDKRDRDGIDVTRREGWVMDDIGYVDVTTTRDVVWDGRVN